MMCTERGDAIEAKTTVIAAAFLLDKTGRYELIRFWTWQRCQNHRGGGGRLNVFDVDWCRRDGDYLWHLSGGGGQPPVTIDGPYWTPSKRWVHESPCLLVHAEARQRNITRRLSKLPMDLNGCTDLKDYLESYERQDESVYCAKCLDDLPSENLCAHCWWCEDVGWYSTPSERSKGCQCVECVNGRAYLREVTAARKRVLTDGQVDSFADTGLLQEFVRR
jgi:hypothetical protein